jgi:RNA polymerase sigma-70 factor (ECF subfamily)
MDTSQTFIPETFHLRSQNEFAALAEPYRHELQVHCYRMLGSLQDAEDLVQETLLRAWLKRASLREQTSLRAWLYKIATNACLDSLDRRPKRILPIQSAPAADPARPPAAPIIEPIWLEPIPDSFLADADSSPETRYTRHESVSLAFLAALQTLPPRQRAVLILRDVLEWSAEETAQLLNLTVSAVNSALHRARVTMSNHYRRRGVESLPIRTNDVRERGLLDRYVRAWEAASIDELVSLLKEDATYLMPPSPTWLQGRGAIKQFLLTFVWNGDLRMQPTRANDSPALAWYERDAAGTYRALGIQVLELDREEITRATLFLNPALFRFFDLPEVFALR